MAATSNHNDSGFSSDFVPSSFYPQDPPPLPSATASGGFQDLIDRAPHAMAVCDRELRYLAVNRLWKRDFGLEDRNLIGQKHSDLFPYLGVHWEQALHSVLQGHPAECAQDQWIQPSKQPTWVRWHLEPWASKRESIGGFTITCEILEAEDTDSLLRIGRSLLRSPVHPLVRLDLSGRIVEWNAAAQSWALASLPSQTPPLFWEVFCSRDQQETVRTRFLQDAQQTLERRQFCFTSVWGQALPSSHPDAPQAAWAAHPYLDAQEEITGVLFLGIALPKTASSKSAPAPFAGTSLAQLVEFVPFGLVLLDSQGRTVFANHEHASLLGLDLRSHAALDDWLRTACPHAQNADKLVESWKQSVWQEETTRTFALRSSDHRLRQIRFQPRRTSDGGLLIALTDVTEFYQKLEHLEDAEGQFRSLFDHAQVGMALEDATGLIVHANAACAALTRRSPERLLETSFLDLVHVEDRPALQARLAGIRQEVDAQAPSLDVRLQLSPEDARPPLDPSGSFVRLTVCGIPDARGQLLYFAYFLTDVAIERLRPSPANSPNREDSAPLAPLLRLSLAFEQSEDAILITDPSGRILDWNPAAQVLFDYSRQAILGKSFSCLFAPQQPHPFHHAVAAAFAEKGTWTGTLPFFRADGSEGLCRVRYVATSTPGSPASFIIGFHRLVNAAAARSFPGGP